MASTLVLGVSTRDAGGRVAQLQIVDAHFRDASRVGRRAVARATCEAQRCAATSTV